MSFFGKMNLIFLIVQLVFLMSILAIRGLDSFTASNRSAANSKRVVNGYNAIGDRRFYVRLRLEEGVMGPDTVCGGTIVAQDLVVTAAHCLNSKLLSITSAAYIPQCSFRITVIYYKQLFFFHLSNIRVKTSSPPLTPRMSINFVGY